MPALHSCLIELGTYSAALSPSRRHAKLESPHETSKEHSTIAVDPCTFHEVKVDSGPASSFPGIVLESPVTVAVTSSVLS